MSHWMERAPRGVASPSDCIDADRAGRRRWHLQSSQGREGRARGGIGSPAFWRFRQAGRLQKRALCGAMVTRPPPAARARLLRRRTVLWLAAVPVGRPRGADRNRDALQGETTMPLAWRRWHRRVHRRCKAQVFLAAVTSSRQRWAQPQSSGEFISSMRLDHLSVAIS